MNVREFAASYEEFMSLFRLTDSWNFPHREFQKESTTGNFLHFDQPLRKKKKK